MTKKERKEYKKILKEYNSIYDSEYDEEEEEEFYDWGECESFLYGDSISDDWDYGTDYEDF